MWPWAIGELIKDSELSFSEREHLRTGRERSNRSVNLKANPDQPSSPCLAYQLTANLIIRRVIISIGCNAPQGKRLSEGIASEGEWCKQMVGRGNGL